MLNARKIPRKALSLHPLLRYLNSTQANAEKAEEAYKPLSLSLEAQRALWANHFIKTIIREQMETTISSPTLSQKLINSPNPIPELKFDQKIKKEMTDIFTKGKYFDRTVFSQARMTDVINKNQMLTFYPTVFVTTKIFAYLRHRRQRIMFQGSYGIGKTISIAFYIYLSNIINKYARLAAREEKLFKEYKYLVEQEYLPIENKKFWYWSMDWNLVQVQDFSLQRILAEQATELTQEEREELRNCKTIKEAQERIRKLYKNANFLHIAVLDQINHAVSFIRQWNQYVRSKELSKKHVSRPGWEKLKQNYEPATQLISLAMQFTAINPVHYVLNSSVNIETELLEEKKSQEQIQDKTNPDKHLAFELKSKDKKHTPMQPPIRFPFQNQIHTQFGRIRFWQFFLGLLKERIDIQTLGEQEWENFKAAFLQYACSLKMKGHYRFLHIRYYFQTYKISNKDITKWGDIQIAAKRMVLDFEASSIDYFRENTKKFMEKGDIELKQKIIQAMNSQAKSFLGLRLDRFAVDFLLIGAKTGNRQLGQVDKLKRFLLSSDHNKQLIPVQNVANSSQVLVLLSPQDFVTIVKPILSPQPYNHSIVLPRHIQMGLKSNPVMKGGLTESLVLDLLVKGATFTFSNPIGTMQLKSNNEKYQRKQVGLQFEQQRIQITGKDIFIAFDSKFWRQTFEEYFDSVLAKCEKNPGCWIAAVPVRGVNNSEEDIVHNNPSIDFALVRCDISKNNEKQFAIYTYDVTVAKTSISKKEKKAKKLLQRFTEFNRKVQVRHYMLCLKKHCLAALPVTENIKIYSTDISNMKITEAPNTKLEKQTLKM